MLILIDTNIIIDFLMNREPFAADANHIIEICTDKKVTGIIAAHTISNLFYILRRQYNTAERKEILKQICTIFDISSIDKVKIISALDNNDFSDFEDCLQYECAKETAAECIITRNTTDFKQTDIPVVFPDVFLAKYNKYFN